MVTGVAALVAILGTGGDGRVLREGPQRLVYSAQLLRGETGIGRIEAGVPRCRRVDVRAQDVQRLRGAEARDQTVEGGRRNLIVIQNAGLQMRAGAGIVADVEYGVLGHLPLHAESPRPVFRRPRGGLSLRPADRVP